MELVVGIDMATAEVRAEALDAEGRVHAEGRCDLPEPVSPQPGWSEQDANAWWPAAAAALRELTSRLGTNSRAITALAVSSTSGTVVALDRRGDPVGPALTYADQRASAEAAAAQTAGERRWESLGLRIQPSFGLPKMAVLAASRHAARFAHPADLVASRLIDLPAPADWSHALKSGYDPIRCEWALEAMAGLGIDPRLLPEVHRPTEPAGAVSREAARETGLPVGSQVRLGMTDSCASQLAAGAGTPGRFVSVLGSTLVLKGASRELVIDPSGAVYSHRHPEGWWLPGGASSAGGRFLASAFAGRDLAKLDASAARFGPARTVVYPLPGRGERFPFVAPEAERFVLGKARSEIETYRAILEGVAFVERLGYERLAALGMTVDPPIAATGRGSSSAVWNRIRATVQGRPLVQKSGASTARGACILAAAGTVHRDLTTATTAMAATGSLVEPDPREAGALEESYGRFVEALAERGWATASSRS